MNVISLTLFFMLHPSAFHARTSDPIPVAPRQERQAAAQPAELGEADRLNESVMQLYAAGKYKEALPHAHRVLALREQFLKDEDPLVGTALHNLATLYIALGDAKKAEPLCERILARREKSAAPTSAPTMRVLAAYACIQSAKDTYRAVDVSLRISKILLEDSVHAAGLTPPVNFDEHGGERLKFKQPGYPAEAKRMRRQGIVFVMLDIDKTGKVVRAEPLPCGSDVKPLADAGAEVARSAEFTPMSVAGKPINWKSLVSYRFVLK
jgi:TonB family protein